MIPAVAKENLALMLEPSWHARSAYHSIYESAASRRAWLDLPFGWLLVPMLNGPVLVYRDEQLTHGMELEHQLICAGAPVVAAHKRIGQKIPNAKKDYGQAVGRLKMLHRERVHLSIGYSSPHLLDPAWRPPRRALMLFDDLITNVG